MKLGKPVVSIPFIHKENGFKLLCHILRKYEDTGRLDEHAQLLKEISRNMSTFMNVEMNTALEIAQKWATLKFEDYQPVKRDIIKHRNIIKATEEMYYET